MSEPTEAMEIAEITDLKGACTPMVDERGSTIWSRCP